MIFLTFIKKHFRNFGKLHNEIKVEEMRLHNGWKLIKVKSYSIDEKQVKKGCIINHKLHNDWKIEVVQ